MQFMSNRYNVLTILSYIDMAIAIENGNFLSSETSNEIIVPLHERSINITDTRPLENKSRTELYDAFNTTKQPVVEFTDSQGLLNVTNSEFENSTEENDSEIDDIHSSFNLAIIPAVAVLVVIVITCIKCCKWFRQYTKGGSKDDKFYAVIITDDDKDYDRIDITSDTASTVYCDTVSSYASFLKRSGNGSSLSSIRTWHKESIKGESRTLPSSRIVKKSNGGEPYVKPFTSMKNTRTEISEINGKIDVSIPSTSSAETVGEQLTNSPAIRRNNRFKVSFVTETKPSTPEHKSPNGNINHEKLMRSSLKKSPTATSLEKTPENSSPGKISAATKMVDVGTQTNKSFRYSLRKSKGHVSKGHVSESDIDESVFSGLSTSTLALKSEECERSVDDGTTLSEKSDKYKAIERRNNFSNLLEEDIQTSHSETIPKISKYPFDTNVEIIQNCKQTKESEEDLDDDVFVEDMGKNAAPCSNADKSPDLNVSFEICSNVQKRSENNIFVELTQPDEYYCNHCKTKLCRSIIDPDCDKGDYKVSDINLIAQNRCEKCKLVYRHTQKDPCETENDTKEELLIQNQCKFKEVNERPTSTLSLESSGYAELSSCESCSSSP